MKRILGLSLALAWLGGCGSNDPCTSFCTHSLSCLGQPTAGCGAACVDPALYNPYGGSCTDYNAFYDCLNGIPCNDLTDDAGTNSSAVVSCKSAGHCQ